MRKRAKRSTKESTTRKLYSQSVLEINQVLVLLAKGLGLKDPVILSALPTLDNNTWALYPEIDCYLSKMLASSGISSESREECRSQPKRRLVGLIIELIRAVIGPQNFLKPLKLCSLPSKHQLFITFSDHEATNFWKDGNSTYWGPLTTHLRERGSVSILGYGRSAHLRNYRLSLLSERFLALLSFAVTVKSRLRLWRLISRTLTGNPIFDVSRNSFRRGLLGSPAFEAVLLDISFRRSLSGLNASSVWIPYENHLWQRVLISAAKSKGIRTVGVFHTMPRFWDLRFINSGKALGFTPDVLVSNGSTTSKLLADLGHSEKAIVEAPALRFTALSRRRRESSQYPGAALVVMSGSRRDMTRLVSVCQRSPSIRENTLTYRPHPSHLKWFRRRYPFLPLDENPWTTSMNFYDLFICDSVSSVSMELANANARVLVFIQAGSLDHSPMAGHGFKGYFDDGLSFSKAVRVPRKTINLEDHLLVPFDEQSWDELLERLG